MVMIMVLTMPMMMQHNMTPESKHFDHGGAYGFSKLCILHVGRPTSSFDAEAFCPIRTHEALGAKKSYRGLSSPEISI